MTVYYVLIGDEARMSLRPGAELCVHSSWCWTVSIEMIKCFKKTLFTLLLKTTVWYLL